VKILILLALCLLPLTSVSEHGCPLLPACLSSRCAGRKEVVSQASYPFPVSDSAPTLHYHHRTLFYCCKHTCCLPLPPPGGALPHTHPTHTHTYPLPTHTWFWFLRSFGCSSLSHLPGDHATPTTTIAFYPLPSNVNVLLPIERKEEREGRRKNKHKTNISVLSSIRHAI